jgi:acetyl esterase
MSRPIVLVLILAAAAATAATQERQRPEPAHPYPPAMPGAVEEVYKTVGDVALKMYVFNPPGPKRAGLPAVVFFFGGGWVQGSPQQFYQQARYLASRGMVAMAADYRVGSRHGVKIADCARDAKSAIRWVRQNAKRLGVDPARVVAAGGSAGGHLAAVTGTVEDLDEPGEPASVSSRPNAMVLFNPVVITAPAQGYPESASMDHRERVGVDPVRVSPYHQVKKGSPPSIIFHGKADTIVPYRSVELFAQKMIDLGNRCELRGYEGEGHGFFNFGRAGNRNFLDTLEHMDRFLVSLGFLSGTPNADSFDWSSAPIAQR